MIMVLAAAALAVGALLLVGWLVSLRLRDASIVDILWGMAFVVIAWATFAVGDGAPARKQVLVALVSVWGLRLAGYLAHRNLGHGEDFRYVAMRRKHANFGRWSAYGVFGVQALLAWIVALPVQIAMHDDSPKSVGVIGFVGIGVWAVGMFFEAVGDAQLRRFKASPDSAGQVMDRGLWRYTRHPNYFGDFCVWWGLFLVAAETGSALLGIVGPVLMTVLLTRVSGKNLLERSIGKRRPGYEDYVRRTNAFFPGPPKRA